MTNSTRILIADDHPIVRSGVRLMAANHAELSVVGEAANRVEVLEQVEKQSPDVLVLDLWLGDDDGLELLRELRRDDSKMRVLVYSMNDEKLYGPRAIKAGAQGYLMKDRGIEELEVALEEIVAGERYLSKALSDVLIDASIGDSHERPADSAVALKKLTDRELQVFRLIGHGMSTGEIADSLGLSPKTIGAHRENLKNKLRADTGQELARLAVTYVEQHAI